MSSPDFGTRASQQLCLRHVMRHPVAFRKYFVPQVTKRHFWQRLNFSPVMLALDQGDALFAAGRGTGKSFAVYEPEIVRHAIARPGEETLATSLRKIHMVDRLERVIDYFETIPILRLYLDFQPGSKSPISRSPSYTIRLRTGHIIYGISVGDDPEAKMAQGKHASYIPVEESHQYPLRAFVKIQGAKDPRGCRMFMAGVPDGRLDTPFRKADTPGKVGYPNFDGRRFHISRRHDPFFDRKTRQDLINIYGGEDRDTWLQEVDAEWGHPVWSAWDLDAIYRCMEFDLPVVLPPDVSGKVYRNEHLTPQVVCADLPGPVHIGAPVALSMDVGYTQPSEIGVWEQWHDRWWLIARIRLVNRMEHDDQAQIVDEVARRYGASVIAVDATEGEGRAICQMLEIDLSAGGFGWGSRVLRVVFNETFLSGWTPQREEIWEPARAIGTQTLRRLFSQKILALPRDEAIPTEFNQEREERRPDGTTRVITPSDVHITDMFRVFAFFIFTNTPLIPPDDPVGEFVDLEWSTDPHPWSSPLARSLGAM